MPAKKTPDATPDWNAVPRGFVRTYYQSVCLGCVFHTYTKQLGLSPRTAFAEARRYEPTAAELTSAHPVRPFFAAALSRCPYCDAAKRSHATFTTRRIEGGPATDATRRALVKSLPDNGGRFQVHEEKSTTTAVFFEWLDWLGRTLDLEGEDWLDTAAVRWLERRAPQEGWESAFAQIRAVRPSAQRDNGWEIAEGNLYLAPILYNEVLVVQYFVSRSHKAGGRTYQGRLTMIELMRRLRRVGYLQAIGADEHEQEDLLDKLIEHFTGGEAPVKLHYIVDRSDFLAKLKSVYSRYS